MVCLRRRSRSNVAIECDQAIYLVKRVLAITCETHRLTMICSMVDPTPYYLGSAAAKSSLIVMHEISLIGSATKRRFPGEAGSMRRAPRE